MAEPMAHAMSTAKKFGGKWEDYFAIHEKMDCSKKYLDASSMKCAVSTEW